MHLLHGSIDGSDALRLCAEWLSPYQPHGRDRAPFKVEGQMAYASTHSTHERRDDWFAAVRRLVGRIGLYLAYQGTVRALAALPTRTLTDLGVTRATIRQRAREAVYGA